MLPLGLLTAAQGQPILVELKSGETINGHLIECDTWMNLTMKEVIHTSPDGDEFMRLSEVYIKGNNIKYLRIPEEVLDMAQEEPVPHQEHDQAESHGDGGQQQHEYGQQEHDHDQQNTRGGREGRGGGGGGGGYGYGSAGSRAGRGGRGGAA